MRPTWVSTRTDRFLVLRPLMKLSCDPFYERTTVLHINLQSLGLVAHTKAFILVSLENIMRSYVFSLLLANSLLVNVLLASEQSVEVEGPCELSCCFDCVCCGPGTKWNELIDRCVPDEAGPDPIPFDWGGKCYLPKCVEEGCCAEGTSLFVDPNRSDAYCLCIPIATTESPTQSSTESTTESPTQSSTFIITDIFPTDIPTDFPTSTQTFSDFIPTGIPTFHSDSFPTQNPTTYIFAPTDNPTSVLTGDVPPMDTFSPTGSSTNIDASMTANYDGDFCPGCVTDCPIEHSFTVTVDNTSPPGVTVCLSSLTDTLLGDLNG
jgi:hypothetical protein